MNQPHFARSLPTFLLLMAIMFALISCNVLPNQSAENNPHFHLAILDSHKIARPKENTYTWETLWPLLKLAYPSALVYSLTEFDIERYAWKEQVITLTPEASNRLLDAFTCSSGDRTSIYPICLMERPFVVALDDLPIYGGEFVFIGSAIVRHYPVIYSSLVDGNVVFTIPSGHPVGRSEETNDDLTPFPPSNPGLSPEKYPPPIIKDERIKIIFSRLGKLIE